MLTTTHISREGTPRSGLSGPSPLSSCSNGNLTRGNPSLSYAAQNPPAVDAFLVLQQAENAAFVIQRRFRSSRREKLDIVQNQDMSLSGDIAHPLPTRSQCVVDDADEDKDTFVSNDSNTCSETSSEPTRWRIATLLVVACMGLGYAFFKLLTCCIDAFKYGADDEGAVVLAHGANGGGGSGATNVAPAATGAAPPTSSTELAAVQQTMAVRAANSAANSAAVGVASAMVVGAGGGGAGGVAGGVAQVGLAVAVSAAVAAVAVGLGVGLSEQRSSDNAELLPSLILSHCNVENPSYHTGSLTLVLEGFNETFSSEGTRVAEEVFASVYNEYVGGCESLFDRIMQSVTVVEQSTSMWNGTTGEIPALEIVFAPTVECIGCSPQEPLFSTSESLGETESRRGLQDTPDNETKVVDQVELLLNFLFELDKAIDWQSRNNYLPPRYVRIYVAYIYLADGGFSNASEPVQVVNFWNVTTSGSNEHTMHSSGPSVLPTLIGGPTSTPSQSMPSTMMMSSQAPTLIPSMSGSGEPSMQESSFSSMQPTPPAPSTSCGKMSQVQDITSPIGHSDSTGNPLIFRFANVSEALMDVTITLNVHGDFSVSDERASIFQFPLCEHSTLDHDEDDCNEFPAESCTVPAPSFNAAINGHGELILSVKVSSSVNIFTCLTNTVTVSLDYDCSTGPSGMAPTASIFPTEMPSEGHSMIPSGSLDPSHVPSMIYSSTPSWSIAPSIGPSNIPTPLESTSPSLSYQPSEIPSEAPSMRHSALPSVSTKPSGHPSIYPSSVPSTHSPSRAPSNVPSSSTAPSTSPSTLPTITKSVNPTSTPSKLPSSDPSSRPSNVPSHSAWPSGEPTALPTRVASHEPSTSHTPSEVPSHVPSILPSTQPTNVASSAPSKSAFPSTTPTMVPTRMASSSPSQSMTPTSDIPSQFPSVPPTGLASNEPTTFSIPTKNPTEEPSIYPSRRPSLLPTESPSLEPSSIPTRFSSVKPSNLPSHIPTRTPSEMPSPTASASPSHGPTMSPTAAPMELPSIPPSQSMLPTFHPTVSPSSEPTGLPSTTPSSLPTERPTTRQPTSVPSSGPTHAPTELPSFVPTAPPTISPTSEPTNPPTICGTFFQSMPITNFAGHTTSNGGQPLVFSFVQVPVASSRQVFITMKVGGDFGAASESAFIQEFPHQCIHPGAPDGATTQDCVEYPEQLCRVNATDFNALIDEDSGSLTLHVDVSAQVNVIQCDPDQNFVSLSIAYECG